MENLIKALHPKLIDAINSTIAEAKARKMVVALHSGIRLAEDQEKLYALGRTVANPDGKSELKPMGAIVTKARAYESWHCFGLAGDIVFKDTYGDWTWSINKNIWNELGSIGEMFGLEWGGHWSAFPDYPHFQMRGKIKNIQEAKRILFEKGVDALWELV